MDAICKADYDARAKIAKEAEKKIEGLKLAGKPTEGIKIPSVGCHDIYGVWFFGALKNVVRIIAKERFHADLDKMMHVFTDSEPKKISDGIHDIKVYGHPCRLYKWIAQGYHRGLVVLSEDVQGNVDSKVLMDSSTWSWTSK